MPIEVVALATASEVLTPAVLVAVAILASLCAAVLFFARPRWPGQRWMAAHVVMQVPILLHGVLDLAFDLPLGDYDHDVVYLMMGSVAHAALIPLVLAFWSFPDRMTLRSPAGITWLLGAMAGAGGILLWFTGIGHLTVYVDGYGYRGFRLFLDQYGYAFCYGFLMLSAGLRALQLDRARARGAAIVTLAPMTFHAGTVGLLTAYGAAWLDHKRFWIQWFVGPSPGLEGEGLLQVLFVGSTILLFAVPVIWTLAARSWAFVVVNLHSLLVLGPLLLGWVFDYYLPPALLPILLLYAVARHPALGGPRLSVQVQRAIGVTTFTVLALVMMDAFVSRFGEGPIPVAVGVILGVVGGAVTGLALAPDALRMPNPAAEAHASRFRRIAVLASGPGTTTEFSRDDHLRREVVVKTIRTGEAATAIREARLLGRIHHPNVVVIHDAFEDDQGVHLVMEYVDGGSLADRLSKGPLEPAELATVGSGILRALEAVHGSQLVHGDVKPANVLMDRSGHAKLADFGIATRIDADTTLGAPGVGTGTVRYLSPERARGGAASHQADLYGAGLTLFEACTGKPYLDAGRDATLVELQALAADPGTVRLDGVPVGLHRWMKRALAPSPSKRFATASAMLAAFEEATLAEPSEALDQRARAGAADT